MNDFIPDSPATTSAGSEDGLEIQNPCLFPILNSTTHTRTRNCEIRVPIHTATELWFNSNSQLHTATVLQAAWCMVLSRYVGTNNIVFGYLQSVVKSNIQDVCDIGSIPLLHSLVCSITLDQLDTLEGVVQDMERQLSANLSNSGYSTSNVNRALSEQAGSLFNTVIIWTGGLIDGLPTENFASMLRVSKNILSKCVLSVHIQNHHGKPVISICFNTSNIMEGYATSIAHTLSKSLSSILNSPGQNLAAADLLSSFDRSQIQRWNQTMPQTVLSCIHDLVRQQTIAHPDSPAVCAWDGDLTYAELDVASSKLAVHLQAHCEEHGSFVPLSFAKSKWMTVAMLAVLKAGKVFVPLDTAHPEQRLLSIVHETRAMVVISGSQFTHVFDGKVEHVIDLSPQLMESLTSNSEETPTINITPDHSAFVLFTSGTSGKPKGIIHSHSSLCSSIAAFSPALNINANSRILQFSSYSYDVATIDTFAALVNGGCLTVPSEYDRLNELTRFIQKTESNWAFLTPSFAKQIDPVQIPMLRTLVLGGEPVAQDSIEKWASETRCLMNGYGPCEASICVVGSLSLEQQPSIGKAVGCLSWVVDPANDQLLSPIGSVGELLLEGGILAQGYLHDDTKTKCAFISDPTWLPKGEGRRLYRTGDLVQYLPDGTLIYKGRKGTQIKLNGSRIELGEVEHHIRLQLPLGMDVVAEVVKLAQGNLALAAFIITDQDLKTQDDFSILVAQVKGGIKAILPNYMIPSFFIPIHRLPLSSTNKLDRKELQRIASELTIDDVTSYMSSKKAPERVPTWKEHQLQVMWSRVLNLENAAGLNDNFFLLGADSLAAISLMSIAREEGFSLSVAQIFQQPVLASMANILSPCTESSESSERSEVPRFALLPEEYSLTIRKEAVEQCGISPEDIDDVYPCSPSQTGIFILSLATPGTYMTQTIYSLPLNLDIKRFQIAWESVGMHNPVLRTRVIQTHLGTFQVVLKHATVFDMANSLDEYVTRDKGNIMNAGGPLLRLALVSSNDPLYEDKAKNLVITIHHAVEDGWSTQLIWKEVERVYAGEKPIETLAPNKFIHFLKHEHADRDVSQLYWRAQLIDSIPATYPTISSAGDRPSTDTSLEYEYKYGVSHTQFNVTISTVIRAAWAILLGQYTDSADITFATTMSGRTAPLQGIAKMIAPTISTLPIRISLGHSEAVVDFLQRVQSQATEMIPYEHTGLQQILDSCPDAREVCDLRSLLVIQPIEDKDTHGEIFQQILDSKISTLRLPHALVIECQLKVHGICVRASFDSHILEETQVTRLINQLIHITRQLCSPSPGMQVHEVEVISPADKTDISRWNECLPKAQAYCIHTLVETQACQNPWAEAVCAWDGSLNYRELNQLSAQLAYHLRTHGVGPEVIVPICWNKSMWLVVSIMAILKAGGACLCLDPNYPIKRTEDILASVEATVVIVEPQYRSLFVSRVQNVVSLSQELLDTIPQDVPINSGLAQPSNMAFVMFTSGSTGRPKGIVHEHTSLNTSAYEHAPIANINAKSRVLQFSSVLFDVYIIEICTTLTHGGCVCLPSEGDRLNNLVTVMEEMRVNWAFFTPSFARYIEPRQVPHLRTLLVGGEKVDRATIDRWADEVLLINCYGPAELGPTIEGRITTDHHSDTIGVPICGSSWIVETSNHHRLSPVGVIGELLLESFTMARGYLKDPIRTASSFIEAPKWLGEFGPNRRPRIYKTGDLVQYNPKDGSISFVGRKDTQTKIRGQRIELGEVEHHLRACLSASVDVAAEKVTLSHEEGRSALVAFICLRDNDDKEVKILESTSATARSIFSLADGLEARLREIVPNSLIPSTILPLSKLPLSASGKLDRKRLQLIVSKLSIEMINSYTGREDAKRKPETVHEKALHALFKKVLKTGVEISADDSFFRLGGDSISAVSLVASARVARLSLTMEQVFKHPVLSDMALVVTVVEEGVDDTNITKYGLIGRDEHLIQAICEEVRSICKIKQEEIEDVLPTTPIQEQLLAMSLTQPGTYISRDVYSVPASLDLLRFQEAWDLIVHQNPILRTRVIQTCTYGGLQVIVKGSIAWHLAGDVETYLKMQEQNAIGFGDPMLRLALLPRADGNESCFILTAHHGIFDGWSFSLIWEKIKLAYLGENILPSPLYNNFIDYLGKADREASKTYWRTQLAGASLTAFPVCSTGVQSPLATASLTQEIPITDFISDITLSTVIRAAWSLVVSRYSDSRDVTFGCTLSGRNAPVSQIEELVAPTFTTVPIRVCIDEALPVPAFLGQIQNQAVEMMPFEHTGLQTIKSSMELGLRPICDFQNLLVIQTMIGDSAFSEPFAGFVRRSIESTFYGPHALVMECKLTPQGVVAQAYFDPRILESEEVLRITSQFEHVLRQLSSPEPNMKVIDVEIISPRDVKEVLKWNSTVPDLKKVFVHDLIEQHMDENPSSLAVCSREGELSYQELGELSTRLAYHLMNLGVKPEVMVPLYFEKSLWAVVAVLGVIKAGGAIVLMDSTTPTSRLEDIVRQIRASVILTSSTLADNLRVFDLQVLEVNRTGIETFQSGAAVIAAELNSQNALYVSFTSGTSTGIPKGCVVEHSAYCNSALNHIAALKMDCHSRVLQFSSYNFDSSILEILSTLIAGACLIIPSEEDRFEDIALFMNEMNVDLAILTPSFARTVAPEEVKSLKTLVLVGETASLDDFDRWHPKVQLINGYGVSECCVCSTLSEVTSKARYVNRIGRGIGGTNTWIAEPTNHNRLSAVGTVGELLIEGPLARGYLNDSAKTSAAFIENPAWSKKYGLKRNVRLYKTGDVVRYNADGTLNIIGRLDSMVKLHGQRLDINEVEQILQENIQEATIVADVTVLVGGERTPVLVAYLCFEGQDTKEDECKLDLSSPVKRRLVSVVTRFKSDVSGTVSAYKIPSIYLPVTFIPLTTSGKIDRRKLAEAARELPARQLKIYSAIADFEWQEPLTDMEIQLREIWANALNTEPSSIAANHNIFSLGGDSITVIKLIAALRHKQLFLSASDIYDSPILSHMALTLNTKGIEEQTSQLAPFSLIGGLEGLKTIHDEVVIQCATSEDAVQDVYPLSPLQAGLMALSIKHPGTYIAQTVLKLPTSADIERFKAAWQSAVESILILRTRIVQVHSYGLLQVVLHDPITWLTGNTLESYIAEDKQVPMQFGDRLNRFAVVEQTECLYFVWTAHHSTYDAWSVQQIFHHVDRLYKGQDVDKPVGFNRYIDFLTRVPHDAMEDFWRSQATNEILPVFPTLPYAAYRPKPDTSLQYEVHLVQNGTFKTTMSTKIHAAWVILQSQYCGTSNVVSGIALNSRNLPLPEIDVLVGPTIATVPFRLSIDWNCTIGEFLAGIQAQSLAMMPYQHMGLQNIRRLSAEAEALCDFQNILIIQPSVDMDYPCDTEGTSESGQDLSSFNNYALMLECRLGAEKLLVTANFDKTTIDTTTLTRMLHQFGHILQQLDLDEHDKILGDMDLVSQEDLKGIMTWNHLEPVVNESCLHHLIEKHICSQPNATAIHDWDGSKLTYSQLDDLSSRLAQYLVLRLGVLPEQVFPICFERSRWTVVAMLSVLKAGGVCCLLDPAHPTQRLLDIVADTGASTILSSSQYQEIFKDNVSNILLIDSTFLASLPATTSAISTNVSPSNAAFIIFTSGTTGRPKGIVHTHQAIATSILAYASRLNINAKSRILNFASYSFDMSVNEILASLICGGVLCIPSNYDRLNRITLSINSMQVNWAFFTPSYSRSLRPEDMPTLETLVLGGERIQQDDVDQWANNDILLFSGYGPTEAQVCCLGPLTTSDLPERIGYASGCVGWITDLRDYERLAPVGAIGELIIQGPITTRGYLHDQLKTEAAFIVDPPWLPKKEDPQKLLKTGDLVRYLSDGSFAYIGRRDAQVKLHGQRIELSEIEHHLRRHLPPHIDVAATVFSPMAQKERQILAAFFSEAGKGSVQKGTDLKEIVKDRQLSNLINGLRTNLSGWLPTYMIPSYYIPIDAIPLTVSGKTDREKLKRLGSTLSIEDLPTYHEKSAAQVAPATEMEIIIQRLWGRVLHIELDTISTEHNFFQLGGDSILAIKLSSMARSEGVLLTVADIFAHSQLNDMAKTLSSLESYSTGNLAPFALLPSFDSSVDIIREAAEQCGVSTNAIDDLYPSTPLQAGLLALSQDTNAYIAYSVYKLPAELNVSAFMAAWEETAETNLILRTSIIQLASVGLVQVVTKDNIAWASSDNLQDYLETDKRTPMRLGDRLNRWAIVNSISDQARYFVWTVHHASFDGWTLPQILQQVENRYQGIPPIKPLPFNKFVEYLNESDSPSSQNFWTNELDGTVPSIFPPTPLGHQAKPSTLLKHCMTFERKHKSDFTTSTLLRAAWAIILGKYTESADVTFGATLSGRNAAISGIERVTGPTITTVPVRIKIAPDIQVRDYLSGIQGQASKMIPYEHAGLQNIRRMSADAHVACNFQNLLVIQPKSLDRVTEESRVHIPYPPYSRNHLNFSTYPLLLECKVSENDVMISALIDSGVLDALQMRRMLCQFEHVTRQLALESQMAVRDIEIISPQDKQEILDWNANLPTFTISCIHHLVEELVRKQPSRPAVCSWDGELSYGKLEELSSRLAYHLSSYLGVGPEVMVPLCFEKSVWMVVSIMAVMKAGGCFVPLDPSHPPERLRSIMKELHTPNVLLLTSPKSQALCSSMGARTVIVTESTLSQMITPVTLWWSCPLSRPEDALYVIFTSGTSSGIPKGVVIEHQNYSATTDDRRRHYMLDHNSRVLQFSSYSFDVAMDDILGTLTTSGCICIPSDDERMSDTGIVQSMARMGVNWAHLTPSFVNLIDPDMVPLLKVLILTGEPMTQAHVQTWAHRLHLMNAYGPSEASVTSFINQRVTPETSPNNIGHPIGSSASWIVDAVDHNKLSPIGCTGELLTEGPILARGYLNDPEKTASAFIECPMWSKDYNLEPPRQYYKTGDIVRYDSDGTMVYIGRKDSDTQIKLNGQRVELGEIEYRTKLAITDAIDVFAELIIPTRATGQKTPTVAVFVTLGNNSSRINPEETQSGSVYTRLASLMNDVHAQLVRSLPSYMIPNIFVPLVRIPLNASGKVDRRELRRIGSELQKEQLVMSQPITNAGREPSTDIEVRIESIWKKVLNIPTQRISADAPFLSIGGDSISAMQVVGMCRRQGIMITTYTILRHQTITQISKNINSITVPRHDIQEIGTTSGGSFHLSPIQRTFFQMMPQGNNLMQQGFLLRLSKMVEKADLSHALEAIVRNHPMLRARFKDTSGSWVQYITEEVINSYYLHDERLNTFQNMSIATSATEKAIDLRKGPMLGANLISVNDEQFLFLTVHHLVVDLVSWRIILHDLEESLQSSTLPAKEPLDFRSWCHLQAEYSHRYLDPKRSLPPGYTTPDYGYWGMVGRSNFYEDTITESFSLDPGTSTKILVDCNTPLRTEPLDIFLAALVLSFRFSFMDHGPPALNNEGHGREPWDETLDLSRTVGWFTTVCPINMPIEATHTMIDAVRLAKDTRRSIPGNGWPYFTSTNLNPVDTKIPVESGNVEILVNFGGRYQQLERDDALFQLLPFDQPGYSSAGSKVERSSLFDVSISIHQGRVHFHFGYNKHMLKQDQIRIWIQKCQSILEDAAVAISLAQPEYTLSDFPLLLSKQTDIRELTKVTLPSFGLSEECIEDIYPLSPMQEMMLSSKAKASGFYQTVTFWEVTSTHYVKSVDIFRLQKAWQKVVERHTALRTVFVERRHSGESLQVILKTHRADIVCMETSEEYESIVLLFDAPPHQSQAIIPLHRLTLYRKSTETIMCRLECHHALMDGASMAIVLGDLRLAYDNNLPVRAAPSYSQYIHHLQNRQSNAALDYWTDYLKDVPPCHLPSTLAKGPDFGTQESVQVDLSNLQDRLPSFCVEQEVTMSTLLQTVWALVLRTMVRGSEKVCFGYLVSGRDNLTMEGAIDQAVGPYFKLLLCALNLPATTSLAGVLKSTHGNWVRSLPYQDVCLPEISETAPGLFDTLVNFRKYAVGQSNYDDDDNNNKDGLRGSSIIFRPAGGYDPFQYDIVVGIAEQQEHRQASQSTVSITLTYWSSQVSETMAIRIARRFVNILSRIIERPEMMISDLELD